MNDIIVDYCNQTRGCISKLEHQKDKILEIVDILRNSRTIFTAGNGGSAATASHMANDLQKICGLRAICLTDNTPLVTAWANDTYYDEIFVRQLEVLCNDQTHFEGEPNETIILLSGSGNSKNILRAASWGVENGKHVIAFIGQDGGQLRMMKNIKKIYIESDMLHTEDWHLVLNHLIARLIEYANRLDR